MRLVPLRIGAGAAWAAAVLSAAPAPPAAPKVPSLAPTPAPAPAANAPATPPADPAGPFQSLYGSGLRAALAAPAPTDDVALAARMVRTARRPDTTPALATLLCEKAYDLGAKDLSGYPTAQAAAFPSVIAVLSRRARVNGRIIMTRYPLNAVAARAMSPRPPNRRMTDQFPRD